MSRPQIPPNPLSESSPFLLGRLSATLYFSMCVLGYAQMHTL